MTATFAQRKHLSTLINFIPRNQCGSTQGSREVSDYTTIKLEGDEITNILMNLGIDISSLPQLPSDLKTSLRSNLVNMLVDTSKNGIEGVRPPHRVMIETMVQYIGTPDVRMYYNRGTVSQATPAPKAFANRPDFFCGVSDQFKDISFLYEMKPPQLSSQTVTALQLAIRQSATYALEIIQNNIELCRSLNDNYQFYYFGSDGLYLTAGYVKIVSNATNPIKCYGAMDSDDCLLMVKAAPESVLDAQGDPILYELDLDSLGVRALYAILKLNQLQLGYCVAAQYSSLKFGSTVFSLNNILGCGSFATVYQGVSDDNTIPAVAIKQGHYLPYANEQDELSLTWEYQILQHLQSCHCDCLPVLSGYQEQPGLSSRRYIVFAYVEIPLGKYLATFTSVTDRNAFVRSMQTGLESAVEAAYSAHEMWYWWSGIYHLCHTDIRPANITVRRRPDGSYHPVLIDWGLAKNEGYMECFELRGDVAYMRGRLRAEERVAVDLDDDYYSIGCIIAACLEYYTPSNEFSKVTWTNLSKESVDRKRATVFAKHGIVCKTKTATTLG